MATAEFITVDEYIASQPPETQRVLNRVRGTIRKALPDAEEMITYRIPTFKLHGRAVVFFAGWKDHYSLYPVNAPVLEAFKEDFAPYEVSGKGTVRFRLSEPVPVDLIERIAKFRASEIAKLPKRKKASPKLH